MLPHHPKLAAAYQTALETKEQSDASAVESLILDKISAATSMGAINKITIAIHEFSKTCPADGDIFVQALRQYPDNWAIEIGSTKPYPLNSLRPQLEKLAENTAKEYEAERAKKAALQLAHG